MKDVNNTRLKDLFFSFSELRTEHQAFGIQLEKNSLKFHKLNEMECQSEDVLRSANSLFCDVYAAVTVVHVDA